MPAPAVKGYMALYGDKLRASTTIRISISYLTTIKEIEEFLNEGKTKLMNYFGR